MSAHNICFCGEIKTDISSFLKNVPYLGLNELNSSKAVVADNCQQKEPYFLDNV